MERGRGEGKKGVGKTVSMLDQIIDLVANSETLQREVAKVKLLSSALKDYRDGSYKEIPHRSILATTGALLYILSTWDIIPDFLPIIGHTDDLLVLLLAWKMVERDIKRYARWKIETTGDQEVKDLYYEAFGEEVFISEE